MRNGMSAGRFIGMALLLALLMSTISAGIGLLTQ